MLSAILLNLHLFDKPYEVVDVQISESFAGRLGKRVEQKLTLQRDGELFTVRVGRVHTRVSTDAPRYSKGDRVYVRGVQSGRTAFVLPDAIRKAQNENP